MRQLLVSSRLLEETLDSFRDFSQRLKEYLKIYHLNTITTDVVEAARESLVKFCCI